MKTAFSTLFCMDASISEIFKLAEQTGINGVELRVDEGMLNEFQSDAEIIEQIRNSKVHVCDIASSIFVRGEGMSPLWEDYVKFARKVSCPAIRVFAASNSIGVTDIDGIVKDLRLLCDIASEYNIEIWLENHSELSEGKVCRCVLDRVGRNNLKILWDVLHSIEYGESLDETLDYIGDSVAHVHLKDGYRVDGYTEYKLCALGEGSFPFGELIIKLQNIGFNGYLSLEWESKWHPHLSDLYDDNCELLIKYKEILEKSERVE